MSKALMFQIGSGSLL